MRSESKCKHPQVGEQNQLSFALHAGSHRPARSTPSLRIVALVVLWLSPSILFAQEQRVSQYSHRAWLVRDGFFAGQPAAITQTTDGYIWVATTAGLYRFDGSRFELWSSPDGKKLPSDLVLSLVGARDGSLWIGMRGGLAHFVHCKLVVYPDFHDDVYALLEDRSGKIWLARSEAGGAQRTPICQALPTTIRCLDETDGVTEKFCCPHSLTEDTEGYLWSATEGPLFRWKPGHSETYMPNEWAHAKGIQTAGVVEAVPDGSVLVSVLYPGTFGGLQRLSKGRWTPVKVPGFDGSKVTAMAVLRDSDGKIWLGTTEGIYHIHGNAFEKFGIVDGLSGDFINRFYQDRENGIWIATTGGLDYFHPRNVTTFSKREGLASDNVDSVSATHDNAVWLNSGDTLDFLKNGHIKALRVGRGLPGPTATFVDSFDRLWSGIDNDLYLYDHGKFQKVHRKDGGSTLFIVGITEDSTHDIWAEVSGSNPELIRVHDMQVVEEYPESAIPSARALAAGANGVLWLGLRNGDLARFHDGRAETFPTPGGPKSYVYQVIVNPDGTVFAATSAGLVAWRDGKSHLLSSKNGLPCDSVAGASWDNQNALWLYTGCGLTRIDKNEVDRWWREDTSTLALKTLDASDGVVGGGSPNFNAMARTPDGRLWIANLATVQVVDPNHLEQNEVLPPVQIEKIIADRKLYEPDEKLAFPPLMLDLEIDYAALSFVNPQQVQFRYKLEPRDTAWQEAGNRRQAFYTDLRPGSYHFRVIASNNDGLWNEKGASLLFTVAPAWYQTAAFRISLMLATLFLLWLVFYLRMKQTARSMRARFDERISERTRLARDLHDTLLQTLQGSKLVADDALENHHDVEHTRRSLEKLCEWIDRAAREGRVALHALHLSAFDNRELSKRLQSALDDREINHVSERCLTTDGSPVEMDPLVTDEICSVAYEAIRNAFLHADAPRIEVQLRYSGDFTLTVRDNGRGMETSVVSKGRPGHFGLRTMRERATRINGQFEVISAPGVGTVVEVRVPGKTAYREEAGVWSRVSSWMRRLRGSEA
jgi:signal transduction histidine kinase/ligand-binding sensor domain-containing protein